MLRKIIHIKGVGKFIDYSVNGSPDWNGEFKPITLIYGENGIGKTTFSTIMKSLKEDDALLYQLRTFGIEESPEVSIKFDREAKPIKYTEAAWDKNMPEIEIFNNHFINENVFTGFEILPQHQKNLFEVIIGQEGIRLKKEIAEVKKQIKTKNTELKETENSILKLIGGFEIGTIIQFPADTEIDKKIKAKEKELVAAKSVEKIKTTSSLKELTKIDYGIRFEKVIEFLQSTIDTISDNYLQMVEQNKNSLSLKDKSEQWIKDGFENIKDDTCPFCLRKFDNTTKIILAYNQYFNEEYKSFQDKAKLLVDKVNSLNPELILSEIEQQLTHNKGYVEFWKNYINSEINDFKLVDYKLKVIEQTTDLINLVKTKASNPIHPVEIECATILNVTLNEINNKISEYNDAIIGFNKKISSLKENKAQEPEVVENELKKLQATIKRHSDKKVIELCANYVKYNQEKEVLSTRNTTLQSDLKTYSKETFEKYKTTINHYLKKFAPYLEIKEMKSTYKGGGNEPFAEYGLYVSGNKIRFKDNEVNPSVKYALSEGDKSALALSFFLAKLNTETNIENTIIIFDDPISSFDIHRKGATIAQLLNLQHKVKQIIVLTHNLLFAKDFWDKVKSSCQTLQLKELRKSTQIISFDLEKETLNGLFKDYSVLNNYLVEGVETDIEKRDVARCIRPILEGYLRIKFYGEFSENEWLGEFIEKIKNATQTSNLYPLNNYCSDLSEIKDFGKKYHHTNPNSDSEPVYDGELKNYVERTFELISNI